MFKKPVTSASQGDRLGICVTQFDPKLMERGIVCEPGLAKLIYCAIISVNLIKYFKHAINSKSKFHITIGHETVMASITGFCSKFPVITEIINFEIDYEYLNNLELEETIGQKFAVLEFEKPVLAIEQSLVIASKLDIDVHSSECRIAFWGKLLELCSDKDYKTNYLPKLKIFKIKYKTGTIERMVDDKNVIVKGIFKKETNLDVFMGLSVSFSTGEMGSIVSSFGQTGKIRVCCNSNMPQQTLDILNSKRNKHKSNPSEPIHEDCKPISVNLQFKRYLYDLHKRVTQ